MKQNKKPKKTIPILVCSILLGSIIFCYLLFETEALYDIDVSNFYNVTSNIHRPISVTEVARAVEELEKSDTGMSDSIILPSGPDDIPTPGEPGRGEVEAPSELGKEVDKILGEQISVYDAPTVNSSGTFVDTTKAFAHHGKSTSEWSTRCWAKTSKVTNGIKKRVSNLMQSDKTVVADANNVSDGIKTRYCVAVGPGVMNGSRKQSQQTKPTASEMRYGSAIDLVLEKGGQTFYVPCVVVDCKAHTYPTWIVQTGYAVGDNNDLYFTAAGQKDNYSTPSVYDKKTADTAYTGAAAVEFTVLPDGASAEGYSLKGIIVY